MSASKTKRSWTPSPLEIRVSKQARRIAEQSSGRVSWPELLKAQRQYIRWNAYGLWARAIEEIEGSLPYEFAQIVEKRAPGFLRFAAEFQFHHSRAPHPSSFWRMLEHWVNESVFRKAEDEGWMFAVGFYSVRHLATVRNEAYFEWCVESWKRKKPHRYPSFEEWRKASEKVSGEVLDQVEMRDDRRDLLKLCHGLGPRALELAIERYVDWAVFVDWARPALEELRSLPKVVETAIEDRCPGFLGLHRLTPPGPQIPKELARWIDDHSFAAAKKEGWLEALRYHVRLHPRSLRSKRFSRHWAIDCAKRGRPDYLSFDAWSRELETYTFEASA